MAFLLTSGCGSRNKFVPPPPPEVTIAPPIAKSVVETMDFTGSTRPTATVDLRARVNGYLQRIDFKDGADVKQGDLLFVLEPAPFEAELQKARAQLQKSEASLELATANLARSKRLSQQSAVTAQQLDVEEAERNQAAADVASAKAAIRQAELNLSYTQIKAPISGRIGRHLVDIGNLVTAEQTPLAKIETMDPIHVYFYISEPELLRFMSMLRQNQIPDPSKHPVPLRMGLANEVGFPHEGKLDFRELGLDLNTGTTLRRAIFENKDRSLIPGLFVRLRAEIGVPVPRLLVEERALGSDQRGDFLLIVNDKNIVEYRKVKPGIAIDNLRVIESGISAGDQVIVNGLQRARPGAEVTPHK